MKYIILAALLVAGCATPPRNTEAGNAGVAVVSDRILRKCPSQIRIKAGQEAYFADRLREGKMLLGNNYNPESMQRLMTALEQPGACAKLANSYSTGSSLFLAPR